MREFAIKDKVYTITDKKYKAVKGTGCDQCQLTFEQCCEAPACENTNNESLVFEEVV